jgi:hypothetical protein
MCDAYLTWPALLPAREIQPTGFRLSGNAEQEEKSQMEKHQTPRRRAAPCISINSTVTAQ